MGVFHVFKLYKWYQISRNITYVIIVFFSILKYITGLQANKSWSNNKLTTMALIKANFKFARSFMQLDKFFLNCIYCINFEVTEFAYCCTYSISKKYWILHIAFISGVASSNNYSELHFISLFIFISKHSLFINIILLNTFSNEDLKTPSAAL